MMSPPQHMALSEDLVLLVIEGTYERTPVQVASCSCPAHVASHMATHSSLSEVKAKPLFITTCSNPSDFCVGGEASLAHLSCGPGSECPSYAKAIDIIVHPSPPLAPTGP